MRHKKKDCGKSDPEYFCDECGKGYLKENGVCEHYYHEHTNITLWFCQKCGEGFHFKSNKSKHLKVCSQRNGPDRYVGRAPYNATFEATFKKRAAVLLQVVPQQAVVNPQQPVVANPTLVIQPNEDDQEQNDDEEQPENKPAENPDPMQKETTPFEDEGKKAVQSIEGEELLNIMAGGIIPDTSQVVVGAGEVVEGAGEVKPNVIDVEMQFDNE